LVPTLGRVGLMIWRSPGLRLRQPSTPKLSVEAFTKNPKLFGLAG